MRQIKDHKTELAASSSSAQVVLPCANMGETLDFFTGRLGFRLEMIVPADSPQTAIISGHGVTLRLEAEAETDAAPLPDGSREFIVSHISANDAWKEGRIGMRCRDLIPGRLGGRFIASHIRIADGGETPDYVHFHKVRFQMIFCKEGWARVVYEDQGQPFILRAGDCLLQPPEIRHRVLETSPGLEVIEIACPAVHETHIDHDLQLPTHSIVPGRLYHNQRFVFERANEARWSSWIPDCFEARDLGIAAATNGLASARVVRALANPASNEFDIQHAGEFFFLFVWKGELDNIEFGIRMKESDSCVLPPGRKHTLRASADLEMLELCLPAHSL